MGIFKAQIEIPPTEIVSEAETDIRLERDANHLFKRLRADWIRKYLGSLTGVAVSDKEIGRNGQASIQKRAQRRPPNLRDGNTYETLSQGLGYLQTQRTKLISRGKSHLEMGFLARPEHRQQYKLNGYRQWNFGQHQLTAFGAGYYGSGIITVGVPKLPRLPAV